MRSLDAALRILKLFDHDRQGLRVSEVSRELGMNKSCVSRLFATMVAEGMVERTEDAMFVVGPAALKLGGQFETRHPGLIGARQAVAELTARFGFTGYVAKMTGQDQVLLSVVKGKHSAVLGDSVNDHKHCTNGSCGLAMLSRMPEADVYVLLDKKADEIMPQLERARSRGVAMRDSFRLPNVTSIAAVLPGRKDECDLALSVAWPDHAVDVKTTSRLAEAVLRTVEELQAT